VDLRDTPEEAEFREKLRAWVDANLPAEKRASSTTPVTPD